MMIIQHISVVGYITPSPFRVSSNHYLEPGPPLPKSMTSRLTPTPTPTLPAIGPKKPSGSRTCFKTPLPLPVSATSKLTPCDRVDEANNPSHPSCQHDEPTETGMSFFESTIFHRATLSD